VVRTKWVTRESPAGDECPEMLIEVTSGAGGESRQRFSCVMSRTVKEQSSDDASMPVSASASSSGGSMRFVVCRSVSMGDRVVLSGDVGVGVVNVSVSADRSKVRHEFVWEPTELCGGVTVAGRVVCPVCLVSAAGQVVPEDWLIPCGCHDPCRVSPEIVAGSDAILDRTMSADFARVDRSICPSESSSFPMEGWLLSRMQHTVGVLSQRTMS
jgi:hypothetical protein